MTIFPDSQTLSEELIDAVRSNDLAKINELSKNDVNVNYIDANGNTALHYAAGTNQTEVVAILLGQGADPKIRNRINESPLDIAHSSGFTAIVGMMGDGRSPNRPSDLGRFQAFIQRAGSKTNFRS